ncbi:carbon-nitrogen hydrolase family protein [Clostridia bacterium]|nr:carbon-nitrogen hydrolase family protein [Clostridia bacterium]
MIEKINVALCQMKTVADKEENLKRAEEMIVEAAIHGAQIAVLPEMFNTPYDIRTFGGYAEGEVGPTCQMLSRAAQENNIVVVGGSIPERDEQFLYNTCFVYDQQGERLAKYRKKYLFDVDIPEEITFRESRVLSHGSKSIVFEAFGHKFGLAICFDIRFPEYIQKLSMKGAEAILMPASFNTITGPAHWEILGRARAVDNQCYMVMVATSPVKGNSYQSHGHSMVVSPWGEICTSADVEEAMILWTLDFRKVANIRERLPLLTIRAERKKDKN